MSNLDDFYNNSFSVTNKTLDNIEKVPEKHDKQLVKPKDKKAKKMLFFLIIKLIVLAGVLIALGIGVWLCLFVYKYSGFTTTM